MLRPISEKVNVLKLDPCQAAIATQLSQPGHEPTGASTTMNSQEPSNRERSSHTRPSIANGHQTTSQALHNNTATVMQPLHSNDLAPATPGGNGSFLSYKNFQKLDNAPYIVFDNGIWTEICCYVCHGNFNAKRHTFVQGIYGMVGHIQQVHGVHDLGTPRDLLNRCKIRIVPENEVRMIQYQTPEQVMKNAMPFPLSDVEQDQSHPSSLEVNISKDYERQDQAMVETAIERSSDAKLPACIIQKSDGTWIELRCPICGRNSFAYGLTYKFFSGVSGMKKHFHGSHSGSNYKGPLDGHYFQYQSIPTNAIDAWLEGRSDAPLSMR